MKDSWGLLVQADGSNGDSAHRTGLACALLALTGQSSEAHRFLEKIKSHLEVSPGIYRRSPYGDTWDTNPRCFSRDQASRLVLAFAILGDKKTLWRWLKAMGKRAFFHQNNLDDEKLHWKFPDLMGLGEWCNIIRGMGWWWAYPILILLDLNFIGMVYLRKPWDGASLYVPDLKYALVKYPTPVAWLANRLNQQVSWYQEALHNHALSSNGCVECHELFGELRRREEDLR
ncbi:hypothetical protein [Bdellovibrio sp. HCB2-146]|uniref:hypothetical protein n=1 Tax=Bdellovibrio sp. HCB2-146 TaxID=3394362 RepID=UPI0039BC44AD